MWINGTSGWMMVPIVDIHVDNYNPWVAWLHGCMVAWFHGHLSSNSLHYFPRIIV
jgi:hypothetical protein